MINKSNIYVSPLLTSVSLGYRNEDYIADKIMPTITVKRDTGKIAVYWMDNLRVVEAIRAQWSPSREVNHTVTIGDHYILEERALKEKVTDEEIEDADKPIDPSKDATENLTDRMAVIKEYALATRMADTSIITQNTTLSWTSQWSDPDNSDPFGDIGTAINSVRDGSWKKANTIVMGYSVMMVLIQHPAVIDRLVNVTIVTAWMVMEAIKLAFPSIKEIIIWDAQYNSGVEWWTDTLTDIWGKHCWALYIEKKPTKKSRTFAINYAKKWAKKTMILPYDADTESRFVKIKDKYDPKFVDVTCAYLIKDAVA